MGRSEREREARAQKLRQGRVDVARKCAESRQNCARTVGRVKAASLPAPSAWRAAPHPARIDTSPSRVMAAREWEWKEETQMRPAAPVFGSGRVTAMPYGESSGVSPSFDKVPTTPPRETTRTQLFE